MYEFAKLIKNNKASKICRAGTWIIAIIGAIHLILQVYSIWHSYLQINTPVFQGSEPLDIVSPLPTVMNALPSLLSSATSYLFFCILLYCASIVFAAFDKLAVQGQGDKVLDKQDLEDEHIVYTSLKPEEIRWNKEAAGR